MALGRACCCFARRSLTGGHCAGYCRPIDIARPTERTARIAAPSASSLRAIAPTVLVAWAVSRVAAFVLLTVVGARDAPGLDTTRLLIWDGGWYREIVLNGYSQRPAVWPPRLGEWTTFPFFPLYPALADVLRWLGAPLTAAMTSIPNVAFLLALFGIHRLAEQREGARVAAVAVWVAAVVPGSLTFAMAYPDAMFLAGSTWAVVWAGQHRAALAGLAAAFTTATRPNGALVVVTLVLLLLTTPQPPGVSRPRAIAWYVVPSAAFLVGWMIFLHNRAGDALAFITAKRAWDENTLYEAIRRPTNQTTWQVAVGIAAIVVILASRRRQPVAWTVHALLCILPALALGVVGLIRYAAQAFPISIGLASGATRRGAAVTALTLGACAALLVTYAFLVTHNSYVP